MIGHWLSTYVVQGWSPYIRLPLGLAVGGLLSNFHWLTWKGLVSRIVLSLNDGTYAHVHDRLSQIFRVIPSVVLQAISDLVAYLSSKIGNAFGMFTVLVVGQWMHHP